MTPRRTTRRRDRSTPPTRSTRGSAVSYAPRAPSILIGCEGEAAVGVEAARISVGDGIDGLGGGGEQSLRGALRRRSQLLLDLGEGQLNGVEVGGVGRQKQ